MSARRGHLLAEALCALALGGVLMAAAAAALANARRAMSGVEATARDRRVAGEAVGIIASLVRDADSVMLHGDTAASVAILIALGAVCHIDPARRAIMLPPTKVGAGSAITARSQPVEPGDIVSVLAFDTLARASHWIATVVDSASERTSASPCGALEGWVLAADAAAPRWRLVLRDPLADDVRLGAPIRVMRRGRLVLYHAGSGDWMLGWRRCAYDNASCGSVQPVAGPLATRSNGGLRLRLKGAGSLLVDARAPGVARSESSLVALRGVVP